MKNQILNVKSYQRVVQFAADLVAPTIRKQWYSLPRTGWYCFPRNEWYSLGVFCTQALKLRYAHIAVLLLPGKEGGLANAQPTGNLSDLGA